MKNAASLDIYHYWNGIRGARRAPEKTDINPGHIRSVLPDLFILKDEGEPAGLTFGLTGTRLYGLFQRELTAKPFTSIWSEVMKERSASLATDVMRHQLPVFMQVQGETADGFEKVQLEMLLLPLAAEAALPRRLLGCISSRLPRSEFAPALLPLVITHSVLVMLTHLESNGPELSNYENERYCK